MYLFYAMSYNVEYMCLCVVCWINITNSLNAFSWIFRVFNSHSYQSPVLMVNVNILDLQTVYLLCEYEHTWRMTIIKLQLW